MRNLRFFAVSTNKYIAETTSCQLISTVKLSTWAKQNGYTYRGAYNRHARGDIPESSLVINI